MLSDNAYLSGADELLRLREVFSAYDATGAGIISAAAVEDALRRLGRDGSAVMATMREVDPTAKSTVDFEQFMRIAAAAQALPRPPTSSGLGGAAFSDAAAGEFGAAAAAAAASAGSPSLSRSGRGSPTASLGGASRRSGSSRAVGGAGTADGFAATASGGVGGGLAGGGGGSTLGRVDSVGAMSSFDAALAEAGPSLRLSATLDDAGLVGGGTGSPHVVASAVAPSGDENPDPKVDEYLRVLDEYRVKCEAEGAYEEALRAQEQLAAVRKTEEGRRIKALRARHATERERIAATHAQQYAEFQAEWEAYLHKFDALAAIYLQQLTERHDARIKEMQLALHEELSRKPVKFSRDLLEWRSRQNTLAKQRKYADAQRVKILADELERRERRKFEEERLAVVTGKEAKFREKLVHETNALVKRIEARRAEHVNQREFDTKRLVQRHRNMLTVLETRQNQEEQRYSAANKASLHPLKSLSPKAPGGAGATGGSPSRTASAASLYRVGSASAAAGGFGVGSPVGGGSGGGDGSGTPSRGLSRLGSAGGGGGGSGTPLSRGASFASASDVAAARISQRLGLGGSGSPRPISGAAAAASPGGRR